MQAETANEAPMCRPQVQLYHGDCLEVMPTLPAKSVQMAFCDLPYGVTKNSWDSCIDLGEIWKFLNRAAALNCCTIFTATQPFASRVISSNYKNFRYDLIWRKSNITGFFRAKFAPLRNHESLLVFYAAQPVYNPLMRAVDSSNSYRPKTIYKTTSRSTNYGGTGRQPHRPDLGLRYPRSVIDVSSEKRANCLHPTQKPVALLEWLIKTYTNLGDTILDPVAGSFTTAAAAIRTGRNAICIEKDAQYFAIGKARVEAELAAWDAKWA